MNFRLLFYVLVIGFLAACSNAPFTPDLSSQAGSWQDVDGVLGSVSVGRFSDVALDSAGSPVVVWETRTGTPTKVQVSDETNGTWTLLPDPARDPSRTSSTPSVAIRSDDRPVVAYIESYLENSQTLYNLYLRRWNGTTWVNASPSLNVRKGYQAALPSVAVDKTGTTPTNYPTVAWAEWNGTNDDARVIRRTATGWQRLGILDLSPSDSAWFGTGSLQLDKSGQPMVAFVNRSGNDVIGLYVKKWNGTAWESYDVAQTPLNDTNKNLKSFALALDKNDRPVVAWVEDKLVTTPLYHSRVLRIKRWNGTKWVPLLNESYNYQYFAVEPDSLSLQVNSSNQPVIAYTRWNGTKNLVRVKERTSTGVWVQYGEVLNSNPPSYVTGENPSLVLQGGTTPIVSFTENNNGYIAVKKWVP